RDFHVTGVQTCALPILIGDLTSNHSGDTHEWFRAAYGNPGAPESDFYLWRNEEQTDYVSWLGHRSLPKFDWNSRELRARFIEGQIGRASCRERRTIARA